MIWVNYTTRVDSRKKKMMKMNSIKVHCNVQLPFRNASLEGNQIYRPTLIKYTITLTLNSCQWCDSNWGGDVDTISCMARYPFILPNGIVSWQNKCQPIVTLSSPKAEYMLVSHTLQKKLFGFTSCLPHWAYHRALLLLCIVIINRAPPYPKTLPFMPRINI